jgi:hypothetical protein
MPPEAPTPPRALRFSGPALTYGLAPPATTEGAEPNEAAVGAQQTTPSPARRRAAAPPRGRVGWRDGLVVLALSTFLSALLWHNAWVKPFTTQVGVLGDADEYSWFLSWVPYAIGHGLNPLGSAFVNFPQGINLMWNTSVLLPSFLMSPVTLVFGAAFSYNVLATAALALSTTFAFAAFRRWTGRLPALAGALLFGFSPYMVSQSVGHLAQTLIMTVPLLLIVLDRLLVVQASRAWVDGLLLGLLAWVQLLIGEEVLAMEAVVALIAVIVLCAVHGRAIYPYVRYAVRGLVVAGISFLALALPFLAYQYFGPDQVQDVHPPNVYVTDFLNFFIPTNITHFAPAAALRVSEHFTGNGSEEGAYIGIPLLLFIIVTLVMARRRRVTWVALAVGAGAALLSLGPTLHVLGHVSPLELPDAWLQDLPFFRNVLPDRFASVMWLGVGLLVALGLDELKRLSLPNQLSGWAVAVVGLAAVLPITNFPAATSPLYAAFDTGFACPRTTPAPASSPRPVALVLPTINEIALRWQAEAKFCYAMPSDTGMTGTNPANVRHLRLMLTVGQSGRRLPPLTPAIRAQAARDMKALDIKEVIVSPQFPFSGIPAFTPSDQAQLVAWLEGLLGQVPAKSHDSYPTYVWKNLPPITDIATGHVAHVKGAL